MGLSQDQMKDVVETSKQKYQDTHQEGRGETLEETDMDVPTFFKTLNRLMYMGMVIVLIYVLNRDYDNIVTVWFVKTFPKEAGVFGIQL